MFKEKFSIDGAEYRIRVYTNEGSEIGREHAREPTRSYR